MRRGLLLVLLLSACGPCPYNEGAEKLTIVGEPPPNTDLVLEEVAARCGRPLVGSIEFTSEQVLRKYWGYCWWDDCGLRAWVWTRSPVAPADDTALAHEAGHYCLQSDDESRVNDWAQEINEKVKARIGQ